MVHRPSSAFGLVAAMLALTPLCSGAENTKPSLPPFKFLDLRVGAGTTEAPNVTEKVVSPTASWDVDWGDAKSAPRFSVLALGGLSWVNTGPIVGIEASLARHTLGSDTQGATEIHMTQQSVLFLAGWQYGISLNKEIQAHVEVAPMYGAVLSYFDRGEAGHVINPEYGVRTGLFLSERQVTAGVVAAWVRSSGTIDTPTAPGTTSEVSYSIRGWRISAELGYRF